MLCMRYNYRLLGPHLGRQCLAVFLLKADELHPLAGNACAVGQIQAYRAVMNGCPIAADQHAVKVQALRLLDLEALR